MQPEMPLPALVLGLIVFLSSQASCSAQRDRRFAFPEFDTSLDSPDVPSDLVRTNEVKRALTLLSRLAPIRNVFRPADVPLGTLSFDPGNRNRFENTFYKSAQQTRRPGGPLRWGR